MAAQQERGITRRKLLIGGGAVLGSMALGCRAIDQLTRLLGQRKREVTPTPEKTPEKMVVTVVVTATPTKPPTPTATLVIKPTLPPTETPTSTPTPTETPTPTLIAAFTPTPEGGPYLCARGSFIVPQDRWTGLTPEGKPRLVVENAVRFLQEQSLARDALFDYLKQPSIGINLRPETAKALDIPPEGDDRMLDLVDNFRILLSMSEEQYLQATQGQLRFEDKTLMALQRMLYRKREEVNDKVQVTVHANRQEIKVARELVDVCYKRWDSSPIAMVEGVDSDNSRLLFAFDGFCANLFLALKFPPLLPTPTPTRERETPTRERPTPTPEEPTPTPEEPTATPVPPQTPIPTPTPEGGDL